MPTLLISTSPGTSPTTPLAYRVLQFHPSYGYEEFLEGLRPIAEKGAVEFRREDGAVLRIVDQMQDSDG